MRAGTVATLSALLALLLGAGYYAYRGLTIPGEAIPEDGYVAFRPRCWIFADRGMRVDGAAVLYQPAGL